MDLSSAVEEFKDNPGAAGFLLDFDGTLSPIVTNPAEAKILPGGRAILEALASFYSLVAIVSGRRAQEVRERVAANGLVYVGLYGGEELRSDALIQPAEAPRFKTAAGELADEAQQMIQDERLDGCAVELKDMAVSLHFRKASNRAAAEVLLKWARESGAKVGFQAGLGRKVVELRPAGFSKAEAAQRLARENNLVCVFMAGDDSADVEAMEGLGQMQELTLIRVGLASDEEPPGLREATELVVGSPAELLDILKRFL